MDGIHLFEKKKLPVHFSKEIHGDELILFLKNLNFIKNAFSILQQDIIKSEFLQVVFDTGGNKSTVGHRTL